jgi:hypothetical protein
MRLLAVLFGLIVLALVRHAHAGLTTAGPDGGPEFTQPAHLGSACRVSKDGRCLPPSEEGRAYDERADVHGTPYRIPTGALSGASGGSSGPFDLAHARPFFFVLVRVDGSDLLVGPFVDAAGCREHAGLVLEDFEGRISATAVSECFVLERAR